MGLAYDWGREIATCHPEYYRHEQKMFLDFLAAGLAYRRESWVNWDPVENTVLANEQVIDGRGWRSGALVEKRLLAQWFLRITAFADDLLAGLERARALARAGARDAGELDRPLGGRARALRARGTRRCARGLHHPAGYAFRRRLLRPRAQPSAGRGTGRRATRRSPPSSPNATAWAPARRRSRPRKRRASTPGCARAIRSIAGCDASGLCRQFRADGIWLGRDLRLSRS